MSISLECPGCRKPYRLREDLAGKRMKCRVCDTTILVPGTARNKDDFDFEDDRRDSSSRRRPEPRRSEPRRSEPRRSRPADADRFDDNDYGHSHDDGDDDFQLPPQRVRRKKPVKRRRRRKKSRRNGDSSKNMVAIIVGGFFACVMVVLVVGGGIALVVNGIGGRESDRDKYRQLSIDMKEHFDEATSVMEQVHDEKSAIIAAGQLDRLYPGFEKLGERTLKLPLISQTTIDRLEKEEVSVKESEAVEGFLDAAKAALIRSNQNAVLLNSIERYINLGIKISDGIDAINAKQEKKRWR